MLIDVKSWWIFLSVFSVINILLFVLSVIVLNKRKYSIDKDIYRRRKIILWCSGIYTVVCAYRSFLPRIDLERYCLVDSMWSNVFLGRTVTTFAELAFIVQCALIMYEAGKGLHSRLAIIVAYSLVPLIVLAEGFSWYAMLSTNNLGSVIEESLWALSGVLIVASYLSLWPGVSKYHRKFLATLILFGLGYITFMLTVDIPMYWHRWQEDVAAGTQYYNALDGLVNSVRQCTVSFDPHIWQAEMPWMTLYFTFAVWLSIWLAHMPDYRLYRSSRLSRH